MTAAAEPTRGHTETRDGTVLSTWAWPVERPSAKAVIVHGVGEHGGRYAHVAQALNEADISVVTYDQRGHGTTVGPRGHAPSFGHLLADLDHIWELDGQHYRSLPRFLIGHSMGGLLSLAWAQTRGPVVQGLILSAPWIATAVPVPWWKTLAGRVGARLYPSLAMPTGTTAEQLTTDPDMIAAIEADPLVHSKLSPRLFFDIEAWQRRVRERADTVNIPCLVLVPEADTLADPEATLSLVNQLAEERTTVIGFSGFRHELFNERDRVRAISLVREWIVERCG